MTETHDEGRWLPRSEPAYVASPAEAPRGDFTARHDCTVERAQWLPVLPGDGTRLMNKYSPLAFETYTDILNMHVFPGWYNHPVPLPGHISWLECQILDVLRKESMDRQACPRFWMTFVETLSLYRTHLEDQCPGWWRQEYHERGNTKPRHLERFVEYVVEINKANGWNMRDRVYLLQHPPAGTWLQKHPATGVWDEWNIDVFLVWLGEMIQQWIVRRMIVESATGWAEADARRREAHDC